MGEVKKRSIGSLFFVHICSTILMIMCLIISKVPGESLQKIIFIVKKKKKTLRYYNRILFHLKYFMFLKEIFHVFMKYFQVEENGRAWLAMCPGNKS